MGLCSCGYPTKESKEMSGDRQRTQLPRCTNPIHPHPTVCPSCRSGGVHQVRGGGRLKCRRCRSRFSPKAPSAEG